MIDSLLCLYTFPGNNGNIPTSWSTIGPQKLSRIQQTATITTVRRFTRIPTYDLCATQYRHVNIQSQLHTQL